MGIGTPTTQINKEVMLEYCQAFIDTRDKDLKTIINRTFTESAKISVVHPINDVVGSEGYHHQVIAPLQHAMPDLSRRSDIFFGGEYEGEEWVTFTGQYCGTFKNDWLGIKATGSVVYLRYGEFHKMADSRVVESYVFIDILDLLRQIGRWPLPKAQGFQSYIPGPTTNDGILTEPQDPAKSRKGLAMVEEMLKKLNTPDKGWRPFWHEDMMWYGPSAFGSFRGLDSFESFQVPFEKTFKGWRGGLTENSEIRHFTRIAEGNYIASGGWPSVAGTHVKPWLGVAATHRDVKMRVCDWWRCDGDKLVENWVFVDVIDVLLQLGFDVMAIVQKGSTPK